MSDSPTPQLPRLPLPLFTLDPSQTGGRRARRGFEFQDLYIAYILAEHFAAAGDFYAARIEAVEDLEILLRSESTWIERYCQIKSRQEGRGNWTIVDLDREGVWTRFFWLYRKFLAQKFAVARQVELVIVVEGDLAPDLVELRAKGSNATAVKSKLLSILSAAVAKEDPAPASSKQLVEIHVDGFLSSLRLESRVGNLKELTFNSLIQSGDLSPEEAQSALQQLLDKIRSESLLPEPTLVTLQTLKEWMGIRDRALLQQKPLPDPYDVDRKDLTRAVVAEFGKTNALLLHGIPKIGKSQLVSKLLDQVHMEQSYFWFTFSGDATDKDRLLFQLATWVGQRTSVWQVKEDLQKSHLTPALALDRLKKIDIGAAYVVFDDCHKASDLAFLAMIAQILPQAWSAAKIAFISEKRIPELRLVGVEDMAVPGFEPREAILFLMKLGLDVRDALAELALLCVRADGHPVLLRAIVAELSQRPSPEEVTNLNASLNSALSVQPFLQVLSERLFNSLKTDLHRTWLRRLAVVSFPFRSNLAFAVARLAPSVEVSELDWNYLVSQILDQSGPDRFIVPPLLRPLFKSDSQEPSDNAILITSARHVFRNAGASKQVNFWDFHGAILALVIAARYEEAAMWFTLSLASSLEVGSYKLFEILFMVLNGDPVQAHLKDPLARFLLLLGEIQMRLLNEAQPDYSRIIKILRRIRVLPRGQITPNGFLHIRMTVHSVISTIHVRRLKDKDTFNRREGRRAFAPLQTALRIAVAQKETQFVAFLLGLYGHLYTMEKAPDLELLKEALLASPATSAEISADALVGIYAQFVISKKNADSALELCERHSHEFQAAVRGDAYFACEHAIATALHDRFARRKDARERVVTACARALAIGGSSHIVARTELLVADSYWAENDYATSADHYKRILPGNFEDEALNQWVRERLTDCLIFLSQFDQATQYLLNTIRKSRPSLSPEYKTRLYARLVYAYGSQRQLLKAVIACQGLAAVARASGSAETDILSATLCDWLLQYFEYSDPVIPPSSVQIRDSSALSERYTEEQVANWKARGPLLVRALLLLGTLFELLQKPLRAEFFFRNALAIFQAETAASLGSDREWFFTLRICRTQIRRKRFAEGASFFASAVADLFASRRSETPATVEANAAFAAFTFIEPALVSLSDPELGECFAALESHFRDKPQVRAWMLFRESELLFDRFLVQTAKSRFLQAETLAADHADQELMLTIRHKKLFVRFEQMYSNQIHWVRDVLEHALFLVSNDSLAASHESFGKNIFIISERIQNGPMHAVALKISDYGQRWSQNPFLFSLLAVWTASRQTPLGIAGLDRIESYLRDARNALDENDFR
jgi:hypothetical protein